MIDDEQDSAPPVSTDWLVVTAAACFLAVLVIACIISYRLGAS